MRSSRASKASTKKRGNLRIEKSLRSFLEKCEAREMLPIERGVINRAAIARHFQIPYSTTRTEPLKSIIDQFDACLSDKGSATSKYDLAVPKVSKFLEEALSRGTIPIRGVMVDRGAISSHFRIHRLALYRHHGLKALLEKYDTTIGKTGLKGSKYDKYAAPLRVILQACLSGKSPVPLFLGRINRDYIARQLNVRVDVLKLSRRLNEVLENADSELAGRVEPFSAINKNGCIYIHHPKLVLWISRHDRAYDFSELAGLYSEGLAVRVRDAFSIYCSGLSFGAAKSMYLATLEILQFLANPHLAGLEIVASLRDAVLPDSDHFEGICHSWRTQCISNLEGRRENSASGMVKRVSRSLTYLAMAGIVPRIRALKPISGARRRASARKSIAEVSRDTLRKVAQDALRRTADERKVEIATTEEAEFLHALQDEAAKRDDLPDDAVSAIRVVLSERLHALRRCAERDFLEWERYWSDGQVVLARAHAGTNELEWWLRTDPVNFVEGATLGDFLALVDGHWSGCAPRRNHHPGGLIHRLYRKHGGFFAVEHRLNPHPDAIIAALVMYLHDSGANTSTARTLEIDCLEPSQLPGHERVTGFKARSKGKPIFTDLAVKNPEYQISTVAAFKRLAEMTARYRQKASPDVRRSLFLVRPQSEIVALSDHRLTAWFKSFCSRHNELKDFAFLPSMIRPSVLLDLALRKDGSLIAAQYKGQHASGATTGGYVNKYPMKLMYEEKVKAFMGQFQAIAIAPVKDAAMRLGISADSAFELIKKAERNGLGVLCLQPTAGIQEGTNRGELCDKPERCIGCVACVVMPEPEAIADMLIFNESLRCEQDRLSAEQGERWKQLWLTWLAFTDVVLSEMRRGPQARILRDAETLVRQRKEHPAFQPPRPW